MPKKKTEIGIRSSTAEYLTFVAATGGSEQSFEMCYEDENIWPTQRMMAALYDITVSAVNQHLKRIYDDAELSRGATIKKYLVVQTEGTRTVSREVERKVPMSMQDRLFRSDFDKLMEETNGHS